MTRIKISPFAIANWIHEAPAGNGSQAGYFHTLDRIKEAFEPFGLIGFLDGDTVRSQEGMWSARNVPTHCYRVIA